MASADTTLVLVRVLLGSVGPVHPEDGYVVTLPAAVAAELVQAGDAVRVHEGRVPTGGGVFSWERSPSQTAMAPRSRKSEVLL